ncbi:MAG: hypothetical protein IT500_16860 [Rubrivivax sp.]|nr:hypothetical protein [Rubrivivax sp.]
MNSTTTPSHPPATLYLRRDGSIMLCRASDVIELRLTGRQLLQLGMDALSVAVALDPATLPVASHTPSHFTARFVSHWVTVDHLRAVWQ